MDNEKSPTLGEELAQDELDQVAGGAQVNTAQSGTLYTPPAVADTTFQATSGLGASGSGFTFDTPNPDR